MTLLDDLGLSEDSLVFLKMIYVEFAKQLGYGHWTEEQMINAIERNRLNGHVELIVMPDGGLSLRITPTGATEAWLTKNSG